ncbi:MAG: hypothetical protein PHO54_04625, partial [Candidatus Peribacteraceae bacterium]|nr:hypothetical protein [Candidatus Peribacteraceae bacterium]
VVDRGACCTDNGVTSECNDTYTEASCQGKGVWFPSRNTCWTFRSQNGGKCVASSSSSTSATSSSDNVASTSSSIYGGEQSVCGDYKTDKPNSYGFYEECDWGPRNSDTLPDTCRKNCMNSRCGDGVIDPFLKEECDDGDYGNGAEGWNNCSKECKKLAPAEPESLYFMITQALMGLNLSDIGTTASTPAGGTSTALFDWNALFFPISPLAW